MTSIEIGSITAALAILFQKGVRYSTVIDIGCADGSFYLYHRLGGLFPESTIVNIDANPLYEPSLRKIQSVLGGHYVVAAVSDTAGKVEMTTAAHPYWNSIRPETDPYWERINRLHKGRTKVRAVTLDELAQRLGLTPPYLLKLDIQGAEVQALRGARRVLEQTDVVVCEADLDDFPAINQALLSAGFDLFDMTQLSRLPDHSLGWFYPIYLNPRLGGLRQRAFWDPSVNPDVLKAQADRRQRILEDNARMLAELRQIKAKASH